LRLVPLWLAGHERAVRERLPGKPLVLEEFGKVGSAVPIPGKFYYNVRLGWKPFSDGCYLTGTMFTADIAKGFRSNRRFYSSEGALFDACKGFKC
jgi:hypothetical protein